MVKDIIIKDITTEDMDTRKAMEDTAADTRKAMEEVDMGEDMEDMDIVLLQD